MSDSPTSLGSAGPGPSAPLPPPGSRKDDCLSCRLTGAAAFTGVGAYAMYQGRRQGAFQKARPTGGARGSGVTIALGIVFISMGIGRLII